MISIRNKVWILCDQIINSCLANSIHRNSYHNHHRMVNTSSIVFDDDQSKFDEKTYEQIADKTLDDLNDKLEQFLDGIDDKKCDIVFNNGVLTVSLGPKGVYVINRQTPNRQIWLSSPISGPKRYDYIDGKWIYKHDGQTIQELLRKEFDRLFNVKIPFS